MNAKSTTVLIVLGYVFCMVTVLLLFPSVLTQWGTFLQQFDWIANDQGWWIVFFLLPIWTIPYLLAYVYKATWSIAERSLDDSAKFRLGMTFVGICHLLAVYGLANSRVSGARAVIYIVNLELFTLMLWQRLGRKQVCFHQKKKRRS